MPARPELIARAGDLKADLTSFAMKPSFQRRMDDWIAEQFRPGKPPREADFHSAMDTFIMHHRLPDGCTVLERFVAAHPELPTEERDLLLGWEETIDGVFEIERREGDAVLLRNLVDELTYRVYSNIGPQALAPLKPGTFAITRLAPIEDEWLLSGASILLPRSERQEAYERAARFAAARPAATFRNPAKLQEAWEMQRKERADFVAFFGSDMVVIPAREFEERWRAYFHFRNCELRGPDGLTAVERSERRYGHPPPELAIAIEPELLEAETVGVIYDEQEGLCLFPELGLVEEAFANPELARRGAHREVVVGYLQSPEMSPLPLRRLAERYPENADQVIRNALPLRPRFSWKRDAEALMRRYKYDHYHTPPQPSVTPLSPQLARAQLAARRRETAPTARPPGRNQPCPCGSGRKYKLCCGR
jgi:hypothetical protein